MSNETKTLITQQNPLRLPVKAVTRVDRSPMNPIRWCLTLECGHEEWINSKSKPKRQLQGCTRCPK